MHTQGVFSGSRHDHTTPHTHHDNDNDDDTQRQTTNQHAAQYDSTRKKSPGPDTARIDRLLFIDSLNGGACLFSVGGVICLITRPPETYAVVFFFCATTHMTAL